MSWALALALTLAVEDPRLELVRLQLEGHPDAALVRVEELIADDPDLAARLGLGYLRGHLLEIQGRPEEASDAFLDALSTSPDLHPYSRFRLARENEEGHPEVAAGLVATLLGSNPPGEVAPEATELLLRTLSRGGDCRLLKGVASSRFTSRQRRRLEFAHALCTIRREGREAGSLRMLDLLRQDTTDEIAREAVEWVASGIPSDTDREVTLLVGMTLHHHREFDRASRYLQQALSDTNFRSGSPPLEGQRLFEAGYAKVRGDFWQGHFARAAAGFGLLAEQTSTPRFKAQSLFQQGRCFELMHSWPKAASTFRQAYNAEPGGSWAAASLLAAMRLEWRLGNERSALELFELLSSRRQWQNLAERGALFLAASDLVQGRADRADAWLAVAERGGRSTYVETQYWRGRLSQLRGDPPRALGHYLHAIRWDPFHPMAMAARRRLGDPDLASVITSEALQRARSTRPESLQEAWILLGDDSAAGRRTRQRLVQVLSQDAEVAPYLRMSRVPVEDWPLWRAQLRQPAEMLLALGIWSEGAPVMLRHFPASDPSLALTGSLLLHRAGSTNRGLRVAEILDQRIPQRLPPQLLPVEYRQSLFPLAYGEQIFAQSKRFGIDPMLLAAIIREESRFDPDALSGAAARGLTQFIMPTAQRLAPEVGIARLRPQDLYDPATAILLGSAYLAQLGQEFPEGPHQVAAAYNAGEPQALLWRKYCYSSEPEEYFTKVGFTETRNYLRKVLSSQAHYLDLYGTDLGSARLQVETPEK